MSLWKRGKRYWCRFTVDSVLYQKPCIPAGARRPTTNWLEAGRIEKQLIADACEGKLEKTAGPKTLYPAIDAFLEAKKATSNKERTVAFLRERLEQVKKHIDDIPLRTITREVIERFQARRRAEGAKNRTVNMDVGALRQVLKRFKQWRRLEDDVTMLTEKGGAPIGRALTGDEQRRLLEMAQSNDEWEHVYCAAVLAGNTSMRGCEVKQIRRRDVDHDKHLIHIRNSKNETSKRVIPLNAPALAAVERMLARADKLGHTNPDHYLWCASQYHKFDPTEPAANWNSAWRALRTAAGLPWLRFHDLRHTVVTELLEAGEPDHVVESITGHLSRRMLEHYSHVRIKAKKDALDRLDQRRRGVEPMPSGNDEIERLKRQIEALERALEESAAGNEKRKEQKK